MTTADVKAALSRAVRRKWPNAAKASDLPYTDYWKSAMEWLCFHAPHVGDGLMGRLIADIVHEAVLAEAAGAEPKPYKVPDKVREIWRRVESADAKTRNFEGTIHALTGPAQPAILTDRSKTSTCGDRGRDSALISRETASVRRQAGRGQTMEQGRLL